MELYYFLLWVTLYPVFKLIINGLRFLGSWYICCQWIQTLLWSISRTLHVFFHIWDDIYILDILMSFTIIYLKLVFVSAIDFFFLSRGIPTLAYGLGLKNWLSLVANASIKYPTLVVHERFTHLEYRLSHMPYFVVNHELY